MSFPNKKYPGLSEFVKNRIRKGFYNITELMKWYKDAVDKFNYERDFDTFREYVRTTKRRMKRDITTFSMRDKKKVFLSILESQKMMRMKDLCDLLNCPPKKIIEMVDELRSQGREVVQDGLSVSLSSKIVDRIEKIEKPLEEREICFGVMSDPHYGSKSCQLTAINDFLFQCAKYGIKHIFCPGDMVSGYNVYPGQQFEVYGVSSEEQEDSLIANLPMGFEYYVIGGNHDYSFITKGAGHNPILSLSHKRKDIHYLGFDEANVVLLKGVSLKLWHPSGGLPYSLSYKVQKKVEQVAFDELAKISLSGRERPELRFVLAGHLHVQFQAMFGPIFGAHCGCFEGQTSYMKRKNMYPSIGGWIIEASLGSNGLLSNFNTKYCMYQEIEDDWKNYNHSVPERDKIKEPLF